MPLWADDYWHLPIPFQGQAPAEYHLLTQDLSPKSCGLCHKKQYDEWRSSWHAKAASSGLLGQLYYFDQDSSESCLSCHIPRSEQLQEWQENTLNYQGTGVDCASCHMRKQQRYSINEKTQTPHGSVQKKLLFKQADFCAPCHQFSEGRGLKLAGKFLENTHQEWQASTWAARKVSCQACHMANGSHRFQGIHDKGMTRKALKIEAIREKKGLRLRLTNQGAGHALPTYATPRIVVTLRSNSEVKEHIIQRQLYLDAEQNLQEKADTRLQAGQTLALFLALSPQQSASASVHVEPDHFYQKVIYPYYLNDDAIDIGDEEKKARQLLKKAQNVQTNYSLYEIKCAQWQQQDRHCRVILN